MKKILLTLAVLALPLVALAQKPVTATEGVELTAKIDAIDHTARLVTLTDKDGDMQTIHAGPEVKRFDELKVGDTVTFRYYESLAVQIRKPGQPSGLPAAGGAAIVPGKGTKPGGTISQQKTATVTIQGIDAKVPAVTVLTEDGHKTSFKVEDKNNIKDVKVGDKVEITYTEAVMITVK